ncbi:MAG TPA: SMC-Scp complex subunit ScpB [Deltaproteobacteria bacterium]|nr:SMC-Scp complex subunit ScpB [Deltaproteobacteria bacterium]
MTDNIKNIIESLLFVSETPLTIDRIKSVISTEDTKGIRTVLEQLADEYESRGGGFYLGEVAGGFQIRTRPEYTEWIKRLIQPNPQRLSKAALETLAIIAYKQPVIRSDVEHVRGVDSGGVLRLLLERKFIRILGRKEIPGRPLIYATTKEFLQVFDLKDLKDLPTLKEIDAFGNPTAEDVIPPGPERTSPLVEETVEQEEAPEETNGKNP